MRDLRTKLLDVGFELVSEQGFSSLGLMKIINAAGATKGSFYHHFKSKEDFGCVLISDYFDHYLTHLDSYLLDDSMAMCDRLIAYFENWRSEKITDEFKIKCLIVKLSGEIAGTSTGMSTTMCDGAEKVIRHLGAFIQQGIEQGDFNLIDGYQTARTLYGMWIGSSLLTAIQKDHTLMDNVIEETRSLLS